MYFYFVASLFGICLFVLFFLEDTSLQATLKFEFINKVYVCIMYWGEQIKFKSTVNVTRSRNWGEEMKLKTTVNYSFAAEILAT